MKINTTIPTQSSFPRLCPEFQLLFLLMLSVAYDAIHMMSSQSVYQQLAAVYCASRVEIRRRQSPVRVASRRLAASIQFKPASPFASPFAHLQQPTLAGFDGHQPEARHRRHSREVARPLPPARPEQRARELRVHHPFRRRFERVVRPRRASREQARHPAFFVLSVGRSVGRLASPPSRAPRSLVASPDFRVFGASPRATRHRARSVAGARDRAFRASRSPSIVDDRRDKTDRKNLSRVRARRAIDRPTATDRGHAGCAARWVTIAIARARRSSASTRASARRVNDVDARCDVDARARGRARGERCGARRGTRGTTDDARDVTDRGDAGTDDARARGARRRDGARDGIRERCARGRGAREAGRGRMGEGRRDARATRGDARVERRVAADDVRGERNDDDDDDDDDGSPVGIVE